MAVGCQGSSGAPGTPVALRSTTSLVAWSKILVMADTKATNSPAASALKQMADDEIASLKATYAKREAAAKRYEVAATAIAEAETAIAKARDEQAAAVAILVETGMAPPGIAELLGVDQRQIRPAQAQSRSRPRARADRAPSSAPSQSVASPPASPPHDAPRPGPVTGGLSAPGSPSGLSVVA